MYSIILFVGLPGSGKTYWAKKMCDIVIDDINSLNQLPSEQELGSQDMGITDVNFCDSEMLDNAIKILKSKYPKHAIGLSYFENNPQKCINNVNFRNDGRRVENTIELFAKIYNPPETARLIWQKNA
jgi:hypothetical protein